MPVVQTPQSRLRFGVARRDITPPVGIYHRMWGAASHDRSTGVHRPLTATALVFQDESSASTSDTQKILVAVDHCLLWAEEMDELIESVCTEGAVPREQFIVTFSHTHAAGLMDRQRSGMPGGDLIAPYLERLAREIANAVRQARASVQAVTICYGAGRCTLAAHRDFWDEGSREFVCGFNPEGPADDTVVVARITDLQEKTVATLVNYACHPTTLAWDNTLISPDFPGALREVVEQATGAPCVFVQGASGDLGPREGFVGDVEVADRNGRQLGYAALAALEPLASPGTRFAFSGPVVSGATIGTWSHRPFDRAAEERAQRWRCRRWSVPLGYRSELPSREAAQAELAQRQQQEKHARAAGNQAGAAESRALAERARRALTRVEALPPGDSFAYPIHLWQMGDAFWLAVEGEPYNLLARELHERFPNVPIILATLANGSRCGYLPSEETYGKGIYQETIAVLAPGCLEQIADSIGREIQGWLGGS